MNIYIYITQFKKQWILFWTYYLRGCRRCNGRKDWQKKNNNKNRKCENRFKRKDKLGFEIRIHDDEEMPGQWPCFLYPAKISLIFSDRWVQRGGIGIELNKQMEWMEEKYCSWPYVLWGRHRYYLLNVSDLYGIRNLSRLEGQKWKYLFIFYFCLGTVSWVGPNLLGVTFKSINAQITLVRWW